MFSWGNLGIQWNVQLNKWYWNVVSWEKTELDEGLLGKSSNIPMVDVLFPCLITGGYSPFLCKARYPLTTSLLIGDMTFMIRLGVYRKILRMNGNVLCGSFGDVPFGKFLCVVVF